MSASHTTEFSYAAYFGAHPDAPSWQRQVVAFATCFAVGFLGTGVGEALGATLMAGSYLLTGSAFVAMSLYWLSFVVALVASVYAASAVGNYILDRRIDRDWAALKNGAKSLFGSSRRLADKAIAKARYAVVPTAKEVA